ncbi:hypothetical protein T4E_10199 [Trichinella pseudospiralis]|uniref:Uncharacterized protein n=1 Tax=Trichinella pseudospiralis TaxID=6337 RepID=A0A0V0XG67_TRIPS|nr:hypothetical protein T4E_10199 [Trichinella pseudospiralis]
MGNYDRNVEQLKRTTAVSVSFENNKNQISIGEYFQDVHAPERAIPPPYCNAAKDWREPEDGRGRDSGVRRREKSLYVPAAHVALSASSQELRRRGN